jgi:hypothetical protein
MPVLSTAQQEVLKVIQQQQHFCPLSSEQFGNKRYSLQCDMELKKINKK